MSRAQVRGEIRRKANSPRLNEAVEGIVLGVVLDSIGKVEPYLR